MKLYVKLFFIAIFFKRGFNRNTDFIRVSASYTASDDVTNCHT